MPMLINVINDPFVGNPTIDPALDANPVVNISQEDRSNPFYLRSIFTYGDRDSESEFFTWQIRERPMSLPQEHRSICGSGFVLIVS